MCQSPIQVLLAEDDPDLLTHLKTLLTQVPESWAPESWVPDSQISNSQISNSQISNPQYQVTLAQTHEFFQYFAEHSHDIYLVSSVITQSPEFINLYDIACNSQHQPIILFELTLSDSELLTSDSENPSPKSTQFQVRRLRCDRSQLSSKLLDQVIQSEINRANHFNQQVDHLLVQPNHHQTIMKSNIELESQVERFRLALQGEGDHIWDWDLTTQTLLLFPACPWLSDINSDTTQDDPALANLTAPNSTPCLTVPSGTLALDSTRCNAQVWFNRIHPQDLPGVQREITAHLEGKTTRFASKYRFLQPEGRYCWVLSRGHAVRNLANEPIRMVGLQTDISYWKRNHTKPVADALHDSLTGLPNRVSLMDALRHAGERSSRQPEFLFAVLFIDLDRFKMINDSLGHRVGDQLLIEIAQRLAAQLRPDDTIARLGGDEFVIVLQNIQSLEKALATTEALLQELSIPFCIEGRDIFTSASIGIALSSTGFIHPENLLRDADLAMYRAKSEGRGRYALFHPRMHTSAVAMLELETDLRRALERNELRLYYQPIVSLRTNRLVGFEALIRWQHPQQGLISPAKFVPIAEETGLIQPIGQWVLQEACMQMRRWQQQFPEWQSLTVNVNLSSHQFTPYLVDQVRQILAETELAGQSLKLEITESVLMSHAESAITTLSQLKELGIQLAIDDFGTGYSSLSYLHRFPIDTLKVDRAFIQRVDVDGEQLAIVRTIITLAWNLGMEVVAEGVETPKQLAQLRSLRCEYAQGYLFSKPQDVKSTEELLTQELVEHHFDPFGGHRAV